MQVKANSTQIAEIRNIFTEKPKELAVSFNLEEDSEDVAMTTDEIVTSSFQTESLIFGSESNDNAEMKGSRFSASVQDNQRLQKTMLDFSQDSKIEDSNDSNNLLQSLL